MQNTEKVQTVRFCFENYEVLEVGMEDIECLSIRQVGYCFCYSRMEEHAYGGVYFRLKSQVKSGRFPNYFHLSEDLGLRPYNRETMIWRLKADDITSIVLHYENGKEREIWVPFEPSSVDCVNSVLQTTTVDEQGRVEVRILPEADRAKTSENKSS